MSRELRRVLSVPVLIASTVAGGGDFWFAERLLTALVSREARHRVYSLGTTCTMYVGLFFFFFFIQ